MYKFRKPRNIETTKFISLRLEHFDVGEMLKHWIDHIKSNIWITRPTPSIAVLRVIIHGIGILIVAWIHGPKDYAFN